MLATIKHFGKFASFKIQESIVKWNYSKRGGDSFPIDAVYGSDLDDDFDFKAITNIN